MGTSSEAAEESENSPHALRPHRLDDVSFGMLCSTGERLRATHALLDAEYSRRLLLLRVLVDEVTARPAAVGDLAPAREAWDLLARAQRQRPEAVHRLLMDPQTGLWAAHVLRRLRGSQDADAPLWSDVGQLHALAAAGAVLAGVDFRIQVPSRDGAVLLPCLGRAQSVAREPWGVAEVGAQNGTARVRPQGDGPVVTVPKDATQDGPGWTGMRRLSVSHHELTLTLTIDDLARYPVIAGTSGPDRLDATALRHWRRVLDRAWALLVEDHRESAEALAAGLFSLVPLPPAERFRPRSASASEAFGCVMLSAPHAQVTDDEAAVELAVTLVHEFRHTLLNGLMHLTPLADDCPDLFHAPWRDDPRPLSGVLHGAFAFSGVARFWRDRCARDSGSARERARFEFALWRRESRATLETLHAHPALTETGRRLVRALLADIRSWDAEPVPETTLLLAERAATHQRAAWRAHHLVPDEAAVRSVADSWLRGTPPPLAVTEETGGDVVTDPAGCRLDAYAHLVRLRITDPHAFAEAREGGPRPKDVISADLAYVAGDSDAAAALYAEETSRPAAWGGLGLLFGQPPELLRAVSQEITRTSGQTPPPSELARWLVHTWDDDGAHRGSGSMSQSARCSQSTA
ncbi:HEXXH motif domain-containing protein [Streptomyces sp. NBC_00287]|uniref:HEXXH motif domain-containing protein n=1 Tax=Streptomyces sp. NBC_00287 TaxID=2975702 RepID=UPI002E297249|nr:HEXXH motif domain-containing protein [Streptomyces sp. NBC_00287]